ncbi:hypothetical protein HISP_15835 [Haloarcula hispanica N601]|uniref:Uncharacterized protein n=1 Tax=Haloarcula hispanica N601 TaxID=1417673 RepID=V5TR68_HALHI|nr:hypothetical protein HISP_15835 [Haloarcula hispanica N601]
MNIEHPAGSVVVFDSTANDSDNVFVPDFSFTVELVDGTRRIEGVQLGFE